MALDDNAQFVALPPGTDVAPGLPPVELPSVPGPPPERLRLEVRPDPSQIDDWTSAPTPPSQTEPLKRDVGQIKDWAGKQVSDWRGFEGDIDYKTGAPMDTRVALQKAENPNEAALVLERYYGPGNYGQDK